MKKHVHVSTNSGNNEWYTPPQYTEAARSVMGGIDVDPASCEVANRLVRATQFFSVKENGLDQVWNGRVWMNPPYSQPQIGQFCRKLVDQVGGTVTEACVLVNNATDTRWFHTLLEKAAAVCLIKGRVKFVSDTGELGSPLQGQAILYFGDNSDIFARRFSKFGTVLYARAGNSQW